MRRVLVLLLTALSAFSCTSQVSQCLDLTNSDNQCSVDQDGSMDLMSCGITDDDVEEGHFGACLDFAGRENIVGLLLGFNDLTTLAPGMLDSLSELTFLQLFDNQLTSLPSGSLDSLVNLVSLTTSGNVLTTLGSGVFDSLTELDKLEMQDNSLTTLPSGVFAPLTKLTFLQLNDNELETLESGVFDSLTELNFLFLNDNSLAALPSGVFDSLTNLVTLWLQDNGLTTLPSAVFDSLAGIGSLHLGGNELTSLRSGVFDSLAALENLFLQDNDLTTLPSGVFDSLTVLDSLFLQGNGLTTLPSAIFDSLTVLNLLSLQDNPDLECLPTVPASVRDLTVDDTLDTACGADQTCAAGIPGILASDVCCPNSCGTCGGVGCSGRDGGDDFSGGDACCQGGVRDLGRICSSTIGAPCVVTNDPPAPTPAPVMDEQVCAAGVPGILVKDVCCPNSCGTCGGVGCGGRDGGDDFTGSEACCGGGVPTLGRVCSASVGAPCIVVDDTPAPTPAPVTEEEMCSSGVPGILVNDVCCPNSCGACGGVGCSRRDGGDDFTGSEACCGGGVTMLGRVCSPSVGAPCVISETEMCTAGVSGILVSDVCCPTSCGTCGGSGCTLRDGGSNFTGREACCGGGVRELDRVCSASVGAPCVVAEDDDDDMTTGDFTCDGVEKGDYCCTDGCGECGGSGCSNRGGGLTGDDCCQSDILESGRVCSATRAAPCFLD